MMRPNAPSSNLRSPLDKGGRHHNRGAGSRRTRGGLLMLLTLACFGAVSFLWMQWATIDHMVTGEGRAVPPASAVQLVHATGGPVAAILVQTGDTVAEGALLMQIDPAPLRARQEELERDNIKRRLHHARLVAQIEKRAFEVPAAIAQQFPEWVQDQQAQYRAAQQRVDEVTQSAVDAASSVPEELPDLQAALQAQLQAWHNADLEQQRELERVLEEQQATLAQLDQALSACDVRAPFAGRVQSMGAFVPGNVLRAGEILLTLAPQEEILKIVIRVPLPEGMAIVPGMAARVRVKGLDPIIYNTLPGKVVDVQKDTAEDAAPGQIAVTIAVENDPRTPGPGAAQPSQSDLARAGMEVTAQVLLGQKTLLSYARDALKGLTQDGAG